MEKLDTFKERRDFQRWLEDHSTKTEEGALFWQKRGPSYLDCQGSTRRSPVFWLN